MIEVRILSIHRFVYLSLFFRMRFNQRIQVSISQHNLKRCQMNHFVFFKKIRRIYKAWYYAFYINTPRNISISSCMSIDSQVGTFTYVIGPSGNHH